MAGVIASVWAEGDDDIAGWSPTRRGAEGEGGGLSGSMRW
jgi:hypothetical protein